MPELLCKILGHTWHYKDYTNAMQPDGTPYTYTESKRCFRCNLKLVQLYDGEWEQPPLEKKSKKIPEENSFR
ncbi:MAG: hypothetical protein ABIT08_11300 [Bacteroidia bacterium]